MLMQLEEDEQIKKSQHEKKMQQKKGRTTCKSISIDGPIIARSC